MSSCTVMRNRWPAGACLTRVLNRQGTGQLTGWFRRTGADVIICTHTCLPVMGHLEVDGRPRLFLNNGFVGMGNLAGDAAGLGARIALSPPPEGAYTLSLAPPLSAALVPVHFPLAP